MIGKKCNFQNKQENVPTSDFIVSFGFEPTGLTRDSFTKSHSASLGALLRAQTETRVHSKSQPSTGVNKCSTDDMPWDTIHT